MFDSNIVNLLRLEDRAFVLLGAGGGIGRDTALALSQAGARVICVDASVEAAAATADAVGGWAVEADVTDRSSLERAFACARAEAGPVSGLVDVVGLAHMGKLAELDDERWGWQLDVVLRHAFLALQLGAPELARAGGGSMVFIGSMSGERAVSSQTAYGAAKAALHHLVRCMAVELAKTRIRVNAVAPGFVRTPRLLEALSESQWAEVDAAIPRGSAADPHEIAGPVLFLASELSSYMTGQVLIADGGLTSLMPIPNLW